MVIVTLAMPLPLQLVGATRGSMAPQAIDLTRRCSSRVAELKLSGATRKCAHAPDTISIGTTAAFKSLRMTRPSFESLEPEPAMASDLECVDIG